MVLDGKVAIITGGTSGIGTACAKLFAENGATVILTGRNCNSGKKIEQEICDHGDKCIFFQCDITDEKQIEKLVEKVIEKYERIDIIFNNAGVFLPSEELEKLEYDDWKKTFQVNLDGYFFMTKYVKPYLLKTKGVILNNASIAGMQSYASGRSYAYSASKAAVIQFSRMMAKNYAEAGIRVNCISPGIIQTPILHGRDPKIYEERIPLKRLGTPEDVAKVALFLVSDASAYLIGVNIPVDGGASL